MPLRIPTLEEMDAEIESKDKQLKTLRKMRRLIASNEDEVRSIMEDDDSESGDDDSV